MILTTTGTPQWVMSLAENLYFHKSASIAFDLSNANMGESQALIMSEANNKVLRSRFL